MEEDRVVDAAITAGLWDQIADRLRARYGVAGRISAAGSSFEWRNVQADGSKAESGETTVSSYPQDRGTRLRAETDLTTSKLMALVIGTIVPTVMILLFALRHVRAPELGVALLVAGAVGPYLAMTGVMKWWHRYQRDRQRRALDDIAELTPSVQSVESHQPATEATEIQSRLGG